MPLSRGIASKTDVSPNTPSPGAPWPACADAFVDSVGVNVHLGSSPYRENFAAVTHAVATLGVRHLRDELRPLDDLARWRSLHAEAGVRCHLLVSPATNDVREMLEYLRALGVEKVSAIEGQNEGDSPWFKWQPAAGGNWATTVIDYQRHVYGAIRAAYPASTLPVVSPTVLDYRPADMHLLRPAAASCDVVALHPYPQGQQEPETPDSYAGLGWYRRNFAEPFKPDAPVMATEAGYVTGSGGVSLAAQARYTPRLLLHAFALGFARTFLYELMDEGTDTADPEQNFGLITVAGSPKPAFQTLRMLLQALADPGPPFHPGEAAVARVRGPANLRLVAFTRRDGTAVIALWRAGRSWDKAARRDIPVLAEPVTLRLASPMRQAATLLLLAGQDWQVQATVSGLVELAVGDTVTLLRLAP